MANDGKLNPFWVGKGQFYFFFLFCGYIYRCLLETSAIEDKLRAALLITFSELLGLYCVHPFSLLRIWEALEL